VTRKLAMLNIRREGKGVSDHSPERIEQPHLAHAQILCARGLKISSFQDYSSYTGRD